MVWWGVGLVNESLHCYSLNIQNQVKFIFKLLSKILFRLEQQDQLMPVLLRIKLSQPFELELGLSLAIKHLYVGLEAS